jgi:hypothetical protein
MEETLQQIGTGNNVLDRTPIAQEIIARSDQ